MGTSTWHCGVAARPTTTSSVVAIPEHRAQCVKCCVSSDPAPEVRISVLVSAYITLMSMDPALFEQLANSIEGNGEADPDVSALSSFFKYW